MAEPNDTVSRILPLRRSTFQHDPVGDSRNCHSLIKTGLGEQRTGRYKKHSLPDALLQHFQDISGKRHRAAPAAGTAAPHILAAAVINLDAAVQMLILYINIFLF